MTVGGERYGVLIRSAVVFQAAGEGFAYFSAPVCVFVTASRRSRLGSDRSLPVMAKEGKKLELYEILAAKRAKGKSPLQMDPRAGPPAEDDEPSAPAFPSTVQPSLPPSGGSSGMPPPVPPPAPAPAAAPGPAESGADKMVIIDDALDQSDVDEGFGGYGPSSGMFRQTAKSRKVKSVAERPAAAPASALAVPEPEPRVRMPREVVLALDTAFIIFVIVVALTGSSYFLGYKRGQEERPAGMIGLGDIETVNADHLNLRHLSPASRITVLPPGQDFTLLLRSEPVAENSLERLEYELAEAVARGSREAGVDVPGFIFQNTKGNDSLYVLAVGLGRTSNDPELERLYRIYNKMDGISMSRNPQPYVGSMISPIRELGVLVD